MGKTYRKTDGGLLKEIHENRRNGIVNRSNSWGGKPSRRKDRQIAKRDLRKHM